MRRAAVVTRARPRRDDDADERAELLTRFARQLRRYRTAEGFTQDRLAAKIGRGRLHVVRLEGAQPEPSLVRLTRLSRALAVPIGGLLEWRLPPWDVDSGRANARAAVLDGSRAAARRGAIMTGSGDPVLFWLALGVVLLIGLGVGLGVGLLIGQRGLRRAPLLPPEPCVSKNALSRA